MKKLAFGVVITAAFLVGGCTVRQLPDPNDPLSNAAHAGELLRKQMKQLSELVNDKVAAKDISDADGQKILATQAGEELDRLKDIKIPQESAWEFAEVAITAKRWPAAKFLLGQALEVDNKAHQKDPSDEDRLVNDTLRLAHVQAEMGDLDAAMKTARSAFSATPHWKWPILYAVYLEIVPAAERVKPGHEVELAQLVEDAIGQHKLAQGSPDDKREAGWVAARNFHIRAAWIKAAELYQVASKPDQAARATQEAKDTPQPRLT